MNFEAHLVEVEATLEEEVFARAALALGQILAGGGPLTQEVERTLEPAGHDRVSQLVALVRDVLAAFYDERLILAAIEVRLGPPFSAIGRFARWDPARHGDPKIGAVSWGGARFEPAGDGWRATLRFDPE